jgi:hypothetical protein
MRGSSKFVLPESRSKKKKRVGTKKQQNGRKKKKSEEGTREQRNESNKSNWKGKSNQEPTRFCFVRDERVKSCTGASNIFFLLYDD